MNSYNHKVMALMVAYFGAGTGTVTRPLAQSAGRLATPETPQEKANRERDAWNRGVEVTSNADDFGGMPG